ncbi:MAG: hypothetical protein WB711_14000 [Terriglobales bacterium]
MPILIMALLALIIFGTIGILLVVAVIMEHSQPDGPPKHKASRVALSASRIFDKTSGGSALTEVSPTEESVREHVTIAG